MMLLLLLLAGAAAAGAPAPRAGLSLGILPPATRSGVAVFAPFEAAPGGKPQRLQLAGTQMCVGWAKGDCDGLCLETAPCGAATPTWVVGQPSNGSNATHLVSSSGSCSGVCCIDFEDKVQALQAFPICTDPMGNQAFQLQKVSGGGVAWGVTLRAQFLGGGYVAVLDKPVAPPPPPPPPLRPPNATLSAYWRPRWHMTGFGLDLPGGHLQDPSAPFQDPATNVWHVFSDCTAGTWNPSVIGHDPREFAFLGWCLFTSVDLVRWTSRGPAVWFDDTSVASNGSGFGGNCGTGGGAVNAKGELVVYCPHDGTGIYVFVGKTSSLGPLKLSPRPPPVGFRFHKRTI